QGMILTITAQARERLFGIWLHIRETASEERADKVEERLLKRAQELIEQPWKGPPERELVGLNKGHRFLLLGRYKIIYRVVGDKIHITDFFDTKRHPSHMRG
ncbi:MAG TPA: type II toxin-antitoxin system RelE/ParE family toxin, partial [Flavobacteriales bacterium]|nr:type II toxin-antitoxin system RelE/ParE family toxin [Flavobacteriales bacterium]